MWWNLIPAALDFAGDMMGSSAQRDANRQNVRLTREGWAREERLSNTAVQRRADDIQAAGGNRALAFTNGQSASAPTSTTPTIQPDWKQGLTNFTGKALAISQSANLEANTRLANANAAGQEIKNRIDGNIADDIAALNLDLLTMKKQLGEKEYDIKVEEAKQAIQETLNKQQLGANLALQGESTALANERFRKMTEAVVTTAIQQMKAGAIDLAALENVASIGGVEAGKAAGTVKTILDTLKTVFGRRSSR